MTERLLADYLRDILDAIEKVAEFAPGDDFDSFRRDLPSMKPLVAQMLADETSKSSSKGE